MSEKIQRKAKKIFNYDGNVQIFTFLITIITIMYVPEKFQQIFDIFEFFMLFF